MTAEQQLQAQAMLAGKHKPDAVAAHLGVSVEAVEALAERLRRK